MDSEHQILYEAIKHNQTLIEGQQKTNLECKTDRYRLRYYIYGIIIVLLILLGKPNLIKTFL